MRVSLRAGMNPAPTEQVAEPLVGAGFMPARIDFHNLRIVQIRGEPQRTVTSPFLGLVRTEVYDRCEEGSFAFG
jgi:hypothetical protein